MAPTPEQFKAYATHLVQRINQESTYVNTINLADRITIDFVWYPGARPGDAEKSLVQVMVPPTSSASVQHDIAYSWTRNGPKGTTKTTHLMASGRITLPLAPGASGVLNIFDTEWKITRMAQGQAMIAATEEFGVVMRLNLLGYHLRNPGNVTDFNPPSYARNGERAVLSFQVDYRQPSPARGGPAGPLRVRGEMKENPDLVVMLAVENGWQKAGDPMLPTPNPSIAEGAALQAALVAVVG